MIEQNLIAAPRVIDLPPERMAVYETVGDPAVVGRHAAAALYGAVARLGLRSGALRARWPNAHLAPKDEWIGLWALPVPDHTPDLGGAVVLQTWYGHPVAQLLHVGPFSTERETIERLHEFVADCGYEIAGPHEEEYLSAPGEEPQRTIIRYEIHQAH
jgi:hypothetical protein